VRDAVRRGDRYAETSFRRSGLLARLVMDDTDAAERDLQQAHWVPPGNSVHIQHWYELEAQGELALYRGRAAQALTELRPAFDALNGSLVMRVQIIRVLSRWLEGRLRLATARADEDPRSLAVVAKLARQVAGEPVPYATVAAELLRAGLASRRGAPEEAARELSGAVATAEASRMQGLAAVARRRLALVVEPERARELERLGSGALLGEGVVDLERFSEVMAPGFDIQ
jgi:hypothetical protein